MKATTGFMELVFILVIMAASIPFLRILIYTMNESQYEYLTDKTLNANTSIEYVIEEDSDTGKKVLVPNFKYTKKYQFQDIIAALFMFDEYAPKSNLIRLAEKENGTVHIMSTPLDLTDYLNFRDKEDLMSFWYTMNPKLVDYKTNSEDGSEWDFYLLEYSSTYDCWVFTAQKNTSPADYFHIG